MTKVAFTNRRLNHLIYVIRENPVTMLAFSLFTLTSSLPAYSCSNIVFGCMSAAEDAGDIDIYERIVMKKFC